MEDIKDRDLIEIVNYGHEIRKWSKPLTLKHSQSLLNVIHSESQGYNGSMILNMVLCFLFSEANPLTIILLLLCFSSQAF